MGVRFDEKSTSMFVECVLNTLENWYVCSVGACFSVTAFAVIVHADNACVHGRGRMESEIWSILYIPSLLPVASYEEQWIKFARRETLTL